MTWIALRLSDGTHHDAGGLLRVRIVAVQHPLLRNLHISQHSPGGARAAHKGRPRSELTIACAMQAPADGAGLCVSHAAVWRSAPRSAYLDLLMRLAHGRPEALLAPLVPVLAEVAIDGAIKEVEGTACRARTGVSEGCWLRRAAYDCDLKAAGRFCNLDSCAAALRPVRTRALCAQRPFTSCGFGVAADERARCTKLHLRNLFDGPAWYLRGFVVGTCAGAKPGKRDDASCRQVTACANCVLPRRPRNPAWPCVKIVLGYASAQLVR